MALKTVRVWLQNCPLAQHRTTGSRRHIPLAEDQDEWISAQRGCISISYNWIAVKRRKDRYERKCLPSSWKLGNGQSRACPLKVLHESLVTNKGRALTTNKFMTEQASDPYCMEVYNTAGSPGSVYLPDRSGFLIIQVQIDSAPHKVVPTSLRAVIL